MLRRSTTLRAGHTYISEQVFRKRKAYFTKKDVGLLVKNVPKPKDPMEMLSGGGDPMMAMGMMKNQMVFMVSQGLLLYWVNFLFNNFVVAKTPFPLSYQFKGMLQRGVDVQSLDPCYVSAFCWYMFVMMCRPIYLVQLHHHHHHLHHSCPRTISKAQWDVKLPCSIIIMVI